MENSISDKIKSIPLFKKLSEQNIESISSDLNQVFFKEGDTIFEEGDLGDCLYIIEKGAVQVVIDQPESDEKIVLSTLSQGDYFGEMALITGEPRSAAVVAITDVELLQLDKKGFDQLIINNPSISLSLSHMLSQRLKKANIQRVETEEFYQSKIMPTGNLEENSPFEVLKFCEQNSLTGQLLLENDELNATLYFSKGNLEKINLGDLNEDEAMDTILAIKNGRFTIEPSLFAIEEVTEMEKKQESKTKDTKNLLELFSSQFLAKLVLTIGSRQLIELTDSTKNQLQPFFPTLSECEFKILPTVSVNLYKVEKWQDKQILALAVFVRYLYESCRSLVTGMSFLNLNEFTPENHDQLKKLSFFEYIEHAREFAK